jgi:hypothetical protein
MVRQNLEDHDYRAIRTALWKKWRRLTSDKNFILETARLKLHLTAAFNDDPAKVRAFFGPVFDPALARGKEIQSQLKHVASPKLRAVLQRYVRYTIQFGVVMRLASHAPYFRTQANNADPRTKFHVKLGRGSLEPSTSASWDGQTPISEFFGSEEVKVGPEMQKLIDAGLAKYVQVEDAQEHSLFKQLLDFAYSPEGIGFLLLNTDPPFLLCIVGENISVETTWRRSSKVVAEFQKRHYGRVKAGRPVMMAKLKKELAAVLRGKATGMQLAVLLADGESGKDVYSKFSSLSQLKRKLQI